MVHDDSLNQYFSSLFFFFNLCEEQNSGQWYISTMMVGCKWVDKVFSFLIYSLIENQSQLQTTVGILNNSVGEKVGLRKAITKHKIECLPFLSVLFGTRVACRN